MVKNNNIRMDARTHFMEVGDEEGRLNSFTPSINSTMAL